MRVRSTVPLEVLRGAPGVEHAEIVDSWIECAAHPEATPRAHADSCRKAGSEVHAVIPRRSLEEYFLSITEGASDVHVPAGIEPRKEA